jgi:hypothetical protein
MTDTIGPRTRPCFPFGPFLECLCGVCSRSTHVPSARQSMKRIIRGCVLPSSRFLVGMPRIIISSFGILFQQLGIWLGFAFNFSNYLLFLHLPPGFQLRYCLLGARLNFLKCYFRFFSLNQPSFILNSTFVFGSPS